MMRFKPRQFAIAICVAATLACGCKRESSTKPEANIQSKTVAPSQPQATPAASEPAVTTPSLPTVTRPSGPIEFVDVTAQAGIHFKHNTGAFGKKYLPETMGSGVCVIDYDNDGWPDIFFVNSMDWPEHKPGKSYPALYHNNHDGTFTDVTKQAGLAIETYGLGCAVGDYDNDGFADLYLTTVGSNHLFHNLGNGKFADVTDKAGVASPGFSASAAWVDYDNDGKLDLLVTHYIEWSIEKDQYCTLDNKNKSYCTPQTYKGVTQRLYHNKGNGIFEDVTKKAGLYDPTAKGLGIALLDYDNDRWIDLFITNDTEPNKLYHNNHDGTFTDVGVAAGVAFSESGRVRAGMGTDAGDFDGSGFPGLIIGNFTNESMALYRNDGSGLFSDESMRSGIGQATNQALTFGCFFMDYDLDGNLDVFGANGHVSDDIAVVQPTVRYAQPVGAYRNLGKGKFEDVSAKLGKAMQKPVVGRGIAYADFFGDGALDLVMTANNGQARLLRNVNANQNDVLRVKLIGTKSNRDAIGAKVTMTTNTGAAQLRIMKGGSSYLSQSELILTFGLGKADSVKGTKLQIVWPSGLKETLADVKPNKVVTVRESKGIISTVPINFNSVPVR